MTTEPRDIDTCPECGAISECRIDASEAAARRSLRRQLEDASARIAELTEALEAHAVWSDAEESPKTTTLYERLDLCRYAEWLTDKALGRPHTPEFEGVPELILTIHRGCNDH